MSVAEFQIIRGTSQQLIANLVNQNGSALDLTGNSAMSLYVGSARPTAAASLILSKTVTLYSAAIDGIVTYTFVPADTSSLSTGDYYAEVHITYVSGVEYRTRQPFLFRIVERVRTT